MYGFLFVKIDKLQLDSIQAFSASEAKDYFLSLLSFFFFFWGGVFLKKFY